MSYWRSYRDFSFSQLSQVFIKNQTHPTVNKIISIICGENTLGKKISFSGHFDWNNIFLFEDEKKEE